RKATPIHLDIAAETEENASEVVSFNSQADDYDLAPSSRRIAVSIHGEIFTVPVEEGDIKQLTDSPARDRNVSYSPVASRIETITQNAYSQLRYERWVKERRKKVDELSGGRIGYIHIRAMDQPSLRKFEKEIREFRNKDAMIIDQRWNGGGNIEQELLAILVQREYQVWVPRGVEASGRPFAGYFGPKVVL